jgi:peptidoglycan/xylan/chitin deacetylase (PgdA/CDA1 family)
MARVNDLLVLCYHGVSETWPAATTVRPDAFERQLEAFARRGYVGATLADALTELPAERTLVVTFDDAHSSVLEHAAPVLERLGMPATVFVPTDYPDSGRPMGWDGYDVWMGTEHEHELACMGWDELRGLAARGWEIGAHTCSHPRLSQVDDPTIASELTRSREVCERELDAPCRSLAYPYSDYDERAVRAACAAGYQFAVSVPTGPQAPLPLQWPRVGVYHRDDARRVRMRARMRRLAPSPVARAIRAARGGGS